MPASRAANERLQFCLHARGYAACLSNDFLALIVLIGFVSTLLALAHENEGARQARNYRVDDDDPEQYRFYCVMKEQIELLRKDMDSSSQGPSVDGVATCCANGEMRLKGAVDNPRSGPCPALPEEPATLEESIWAPRSSALDADMVRRFRAAKLVDNVPYFAQ